MSANLAGQLKSTPHDEYVAALATCLPTGTKRAGSRDAQPPSATLLQKPARQAGPVADIQFARRKVRDPAHTGCEKVFPAALGSDQILLRRFRFAFLLGLKR